MSAKGTQRRLAAVLAIDMVGYSRLIGIDEEGTLERQKNYRKELIDPAIKGYNGRIVKSTGDGLLAEFPSVVDALRCAVSFQLAMPAREAGVPQDQNIQYRVGINIGDIVIDEGDIYGDGVNVASRLEALAEPGGICVSRAALDQVRGKVNSRFEDLGPQRVKNIAEPVEVFRVQMRPETAAAGDDDSGRKWFLPRWAVVSTGVLLVIAAASLAFKHLHLPDPNQESAEELNPSLTDKSSIAVLPFANMSGDPEQEYFSDGVTEDIITDLSRVSDLLVISRTSTLGFRGQAIDIKSVGNQLGVRYLVEGSVRKSGNNVRITAQLIDASTGYHLWAEKYDRELSEVFAVQDEVTRKIVAALSVRLTDKEQQFLERRHTDSTQAYEHYLRARLLFGLVTKQENEAARKMYRKAIELDPNYAKAYAGLALTYVDDFRRLWGSREQESVNRAIDLANKAIALDDTLPQAHWVLGYVRLYGQAQHDLAIESTKRALALDPNYADAYALLGSIHFFTGQLEEAIRYDEIALRLNPSSNSYVYRVHLGRSYYMQDRFDAALKELERAVELNYEYYSGHVYLAATYARMGQLDEAAWEVDQILTLVPEFSIEKWREIRFFENTEHLDRLTNDLYKAGLK